MGYVGTAIRRTRDERLLTGRGHYIADLMLPGQVYAAFVRSPHGHARVRGVDVAPALKVPGVIAVYGGHDVKASPLPLLFPFPTLEPVTQIPLGSEVCHVGEPVAMVIATDRYAAEDGVARVVVDYEPMPAVTDMRRALAPDAPRVHRDKPSNQAARIVQAVGDAAAALKDAPVVVECQLFMGRVSCLPIETRGLVAEWRYEAGEERLMVYAATQTPHMMRRLYAELFGLGEHQIAVKAPDVGGAFGAKEPFYVEDYLVAWAARALQRPVAWIEDRTEHLLSAVHEREQYHEAKMGLTRDGQILAVVDSFLANTGAYVPWGVIVPIITSTLIPGPYKVPHYACEGTVAYTNTVPLAPYRGAGRPQAALVINRLLDIAAQKLHLDPAAIRYRNLIPPEEFPYATGLKSREGTPMVLDSGNYPELLTRLLEDGHYHEWRAMQQRAEAGRTTLGIGLAVGIENTAMGPHEGATVTIAPDGGVIVATGAASQGQGHETTLAQIAADVLGVALDTVRVEEGDTRVIGYGTGTFASRTAVVAGNAVQLASEAVKRKVLTLAAHLLEADVDDLECQGGRVFVKGVPSRAMTFGELAMQASGPYPGSTFTLPVSPGLSETAFFVPSGATYAAGAHMAVVRVDRETGAVRLVHYAAVHDSGNVLNPVIVDGQLLGGIVAGLGTALWEDLRYDADGQLLTGTLMDYLIPTAAEVPEITLGHCYTPSPLNPLGLKGVGESGAIPAPAAVLAAIEDALGADTPLLDAIPVTAQAIRAASVAARASDKVT
ncbi:MAG: xanthine dehydrogenase family protein molybdopterin-binding subunit [Firmicutes bacterium]|nr:xanthine dehydrogenase family protein molybdopterin-binding subunit [Bacillota bacterium]